MRVEVRIGRSIYGVVVINGSLCSRDYGILVDFVSIYIYSLHGDCLVTGVLVLEGQSIAEGAWRRGSCAECIMLGLCSSGFYVFVHKSSSR